MIAADGRVGTLTVVDGGSLSLSQFEAVLSPEDYSVLRAEMQRIRHRSPDGRIWNISSTGGGGGVAEMLAPLLAYARGASVDARWAVIGGSVGFFAITKRLHNRLHGFDGDGGPLGEQERSDYDAALAPNAEALRTLIGPGDAVILHDPQTAGLTGPIRALGVPVVWRCHVGVDSRNALMRQAWRFLEPYVRLADAVVFSREAFAWEVGDVRRRVIISPSIDAFSAKNLVYAGPAVEAVSHDPEGAAVLARAHQQWTALPKQLRARVHLALLPMDDLQENAATVNALPRGADVVVQKSVAEGFGLTVAEAMWKTRPRRRRPAWGHPGPDRARRQWCVA